MDLLDIARLKDLLDCDYDSLRAKWIFFCSAGTSFKKDFLLKPFPPCALKSDNTKDFQLLGKCISNMPCLSGKQVAVDEMTDQQKQLILWVYDNCNYNIKPVPLQHVVDAVMEDGVNMEVSGAHSPNMAFEIDQGNSRSWTRLAHGKTITHAFHGSRLSNFYSILNHGLLSSLNKTAVFGEGTYLSEELSVSMNWSPSCVISRQGERMSCVAVCQVINDRNETCHKTGDRDGVPERYMIVGNDSLITIKYLLVYTDNSRTNRYDESPFVNWLSSNRFPIIMLGYILLLMFVGVANSNNFNFYWRKLSLLLGKEQTFSAFDDPS